MKRSLPQIVSVGLVFAAWVIGVAQWRAVWLPLEMTGIWLLLLIAPLVSPRGFRIEPFRRVYDILQMTLLTVFLVLFVAMYTHATTVLFPVAFGGFLIVSGNFMGKIRRNFFIGIRTPWTLASEEVWLRTHRLGGRLVIAAGLFIIVVGAFGFPLGFVTPGAALVAIVLSSGYSYLLYRRLEGFDSHSSTEHEV